MGDTKPTKRSSLERESSEIAQLRLQIADEIERAANRLALVIADRDMGHAGPRDIVAMIQDTLSSLASRLREPGPPAVDARAASLPTYDLSPTAELLSPGQMQDESGASDDPQPELETPWADPPETAGISVQEGSGEEPAVFRCALCGEDAVIPYDNVLTCVSCGHAHQ